MTTEQITADIIAFQRRWSLPDQAAIELSDLWKRWHESALKQGAEIYRTENRNALAKLIAEAHRPCS